MPTVVVETGSGADSTANSYAATATIDTIADNEMWMTDWIALSANNKSKCVITGTRLLDEYLCDQLLGYPTYTTQPLCFPRSGLYTRQGAALSSTAIPAMLITALAKIANLLATTDLEASQKTGLASGSVGSLNAVFDKYDREGVVRDQVLASLSFCLAPSNEFAVRTVRT
jgi:hypothetical protein